MVQCIKPFPPHIQCLGSTFDNAKISGIHMKQLDHLAMVSYADVVAALNYEFTRYSMSRCNTGDGWCVQ